MKKSDFYEKKEQCIYFCKSGRTVNIRDIKAVEVNIVPVLKGAVGTILNATTNAMTGSIANGNEKVNIIVKIVCEECIEEILMNDQVLTRNNLDYHEMIEHARNLQKALKKDISKA